MCVNMNCNNFKTSSYQINNKDLLYNRKVYMDVDLMNHLFMYIGRPYITIEPLFMHGKVNLHFFLDYYSMSDKLVS